MRAGPRSGRPLRGGTEARRVEDEGRAPPGRGQERAAGAGAGAGERRGRGSRGVGGDEGVTFISSRWERDISGRTAFPRFRSQVAMLAFTSVESRDISATGAPPSAPAPAPAPPAPGPRRAMRPRPPRPSPSRAGLPESTGGVHRRRDPRSSVQTSCFGMNGPGPGELPPRLPLISGSRPCGDREPRDEEREVPNGTHLSQKEVALCHRL